MLRIVKALINKEKITGVTALLVAKKYDRGNILLQKSMEIIYPINIEREICRILYLYASLAVELIIKLNNGLISRTGDPQKETDATYSLWRGEEDYRIEWNDAAVSIEHFKSCVSRPCRGAAAILDGRIVTSPKILSKHILLGFVAFESD